MKRHLALGLAATTVFLAISPADAALRCNGAYLQTKSGEVRTGYCEDEYLAQVARTRGDRVTGAQIRASFSLKGQVCQLVGNDIRVDDICKQFRRERGGSRCSIFPCN